LNGSGDEKIEPFVFANTNIEGANDSKNEKDKTHHRKQIEIHAVIATNRAK
jgi:hypothetical protein